MKKIIVVCSIIAAIGLWLWQSEKPFGGLTKNTPMMATSSVGIYQPFFPALVLSADSSRQYASFCNSSPTTTNYITLQIQATTTGINGILIPGNACYQMSNDIGNLFLDNIYARASTSTTTLMILYK